MKKVKVVSSQTLSGLSGLSERRQTSWGYIAQNWSHSLSSKVFSSFIRHDFPNYKKFYGRD